MAVGADGAGEVKHDNEDDDSDDEIFEDGRVLPTVEVAHDLVGVVVVADRLARREGQPAMAPRSHRIGPVSERYSSPAVSATGNWRASSVRERIPSFR